MERAERAHLTRGALYGYTVFKAQAYIRRQGTIGRAAFSGVSSGFVACAGEAMKMSVKGSIRIVSLVPFIFSVILYFLNNRRNPQISYIDV